MNEEDLSNDLYNYVLRSDRKGGDAAMRCGKIKAKRRSLSTRLSLQNRNKAPVRPVDGHDPHRVESGGQSLDWNLDRLLCRDTIVTIGAIEKSPRQIEESDGNRGRCPGGDAQTNARGLDMKLDDADLPIRIRSCAMMIRTFHLCRRGGNAVVKKLVPLK